MADGLGESSALSRHIIVGPTALDDVRAGLGRFWSDHVRASESMRIAVGIAVDEVAANIIEHARASWLHLQMQLLSDFVVVQFTDDGAPAQINLTTARMPHWTAPRGRGLAIAKAVLGRLDYIRDDVGNRWILESKPFSSA